MKQLKIIAALLVLAVAGALVHTRAQTSLQKSEGSQTQVKKPESKVPTSRTKKKTAVKTKAPRGHQFVEIIHATCAVDQDKVTLKKTSHQDVAWTLDVTSPKGHKVKVKFNHGPCDQGDRFDVTTGSASQFCTVENAQPGTYKYRVFDKDDKPCGPDPSVEVQN